VFTLITTLQKASMYSDIIAVNMITSPKSIILPACFSGPVASGPPLYPKQKHT
jgi:hypothetical protein